MLRHIYPGLVDHGMHPRISCRAAHFPDAEDKGAVFRTCFKDMTDMSGCLKALKDIRRLIRYLSDTYSYLRASRTLQLHYQGGCKSIGLLLHVPG